VLKLTLRHCERNEAIQTAGGINGLWIDGASSLAMTMTK